MSRELTPQEIAERSLIKTYRKSLVESLYRRREAV